MTDSPSSRTAPTDQDDPPVFRDAESFLAELGVERRPIVVRFDDAGGDGSSSPLPAATLAEAAAPLAGGGAPHARAAESSVPPDAPGGTAEASTDAAAPDQGGPPVSVAEATRVATETAPPDEVSTALSYIRRSTGAQPASEGRLRGRLADRGHDADVIDAAMAAARAERLVDDDALSAAMVAEWRAKGHAPRRIRVDLRRRGFDDVVVERAVGAIDTEDHAAMAFTLARRRAETLAHLPPETAFRRVAGYVARRGYGDGLARKAARDAVYDQRSDERIAGH